MVHRRFILAGGLGGPVNRPGPCRTPAPRTRASGAGRQAAQASGSRRRRASSTRRPASQSRPDGRVFVNFPRWTEDSPISVAEVGRGRNAEALSRRDLEFVAQCRRPCAVALATTSCACSRWWPTTRGNLWVLDPASPGIDKVIPGGPKLVRIELATNKVAQVIHFGEDVALQGSYLNDVRFHPNGATAFITDSGARGAIVVVDLESRPRACPPRRSSQHAARKGRRGHRQRREDQAAGRPPVPGGGRRHRAVDGRRARSIGRRSPAARSTASIPPR